MRNYSRVLLIVTVVSALILSALVARHIHGPRIVAQSISPDGTEMCIVQQCNWGPEAFTTSFVYRRLGKPWGWFYYDHQDWYWRTGTVALDTNTSTAIFYRDSKATVRFDWATETYHLLPERTLVGAQRWLPAGWSPLVSVYR